MKHGDKVKKLGRTSEHRRALLRNLVRELVLHDRIRTTLPKAKEARRFAERMVGFAKAGTLAARREAGRYIDDGTALRRLFDEVAPRFSGRDGGYTRIYRLGPRPGDGAEMALLEFVVRPQPVEKKKPSGLKRLATVARTGTKTGDRPAKK